MTESHHPRFQIEVAEGFVTLDVTENNDNLRLSISVETNEDHLRQCRRTVTGCSISPICAAPQSKCPI
jgi:hypothetical protein